MSQQPPAGSLITRDPNRIATKKLPATFSTAFRTIIKAMLLFYVIVFVSAVFPLQLRNPGWAIALVNTLIQNAIIPLAALFFVLVLVVLAPDERANRKLARFIVRFALPAALGFFFIIPLHVAVSAYILNQASQSLDRDISTLKERFTTVRGKIDSAVNSSDLTAAEPLLPREAVQTLFSLPLNQARPRINETLQKVQGSIALNRRGQHRQLRWQILRETARNCLSALVLGSAFFAARFRRLGYNLYGASVSSTNNTPSQSVPVNHA